MDAGREDGAEVEGGGQDADDGDGGVVERDGAADEVGVGGEAANPESVAQECGFGAVPLAFLVVEATADFGFDTEEGKEVLRDGEGVEALHAAVPIEGAVAGFIESEVGGHVREGVVPVAEREEAEDLEGLSAEAVFGRGVGDPDEAVGLGERQRPEEESGKDAEYGGGGGDAESGDSDGEDGEGGFAAHGAEGVAEVLGEAIRPGDAAGFAVLFAGGFDAAELCQGEAAGFAGIDAATY